MQKRIVQLLATVTAILAVYIGSASNARALMIPAVIPDFCFGGHCIQFTHTAAIAQVQHVIADINMLDNMGQQLSQMKINARTMVGAWPQLKGDVNSLTSAYKTTFHGVSAAAAADAYTEHLNADQAYADGITSVADGSVGSTQTAQVTNRYLAQLGGDVRKNGALAAAQIKQHQDEETGSVVGVFGVLNSATTASEPNIAL